MVTMIDGSKKEPAYYLTIFKIEGHQTYRSDLSGYKEGFIEKTQSKGFPKVTEFKTYRIDRLTGEMVLEVVDQLL